MNKERDLGFDFLKGVLIFLMVYGHVIARYLNSHDIVFAWIYTFHMPLFIFISGYFSYHTLIESPRYITHKIFHHLLLPAIIWSTFCLCIFYDRNAHPLVNMVNATRSYWFLFCLAYLYFIGGIIVKKRYKYAIAIILSVIGFLIYQVKGVKYIEYYQLIRQFPVFFLGIFCCEYKKLIKVKHVVLTFFICLIIYMGGILLVLQNHPFWYIRSHDNYLLRAVINITGTIVFYIIFYNLYYVNKNYIGKTFVFLGRNTMGIYLMNSLLIYILSKVVRDEIVLKVPLWLYSAFITLTLYFITLCVKKTIFKRYLLG
jgi:fucose 4-O-acetylase-like acetyltransferase